MIFDQLTSSLGFMMIVGTFAGIAGYFLMRQKFLRAMEIGRKRENQLARNAYEIAVLKEIGERIGYSLDAERIVEIISRSIGQLLPYSTASYMILHKAEDKIKFECNVNEPVNPNFISEVRTKMLAAFSEMLQDPLVGVDIDESIAGAILDEKDATPIGSFFNLPITISGKVVGLINIASKQVGFYKDEETEVLFHIAKQASQQVSRLQEVLDNEKSILSQAVESLSDGLLMVNTKYLPILSNRRLSQMLGIVEHPKMFDIVNALSGNFDIRTKMEEAVQKNEQLPPEEIVIKDKVLQVFVTKVMDRRDVKATGVAVLFHDITDAKSLEKLRQDFMAMMVHELRAPLTSIKSTVSVMKSSGSNLKPEDSNKYMNVIDSTSETMLALVNDILDVAKMEAGKFDIICDVGDIGEVIVDRVESFRAVAEAKKLKINANIEKDLPKAWLDKVRIKQVLNNLLSNAVKYSDVGEITVSASREIVDGKVIDILISVHDTGIGIEPDQTEKLFSKFGQLEAGRSKAGLKSSGLGLFITKKIVEGSGGKIWVESSGTGSGSTFYFTVPLAEKVMKETSSSLQERGFEKVAQA